MADSIHRRTTEESQRPAGERRRCGDAEQTAVGRGSEGEGLGTESPGVERARDRPPARPWPQHGEPLPASAGRHSPEDPPGAERCLSRDEREEISRGIAGGHSARAIARTLERSHTTIVREINRCGGRDRYRANAADREAWRRSRRPRSTKLELCRELRRVIEERLGDDHSPEQIAGWLRLAYPDNEAMQLSHQTIYRALYVQGRGALKRELTQHLRRGRSRRYARSQSSKRSGPGKADRDGDDLRATARGRGPRRPRPLGGRPCDGQPPKPRRDRDPGRAPDPLPAARRAARGHRGRAGR